MNLFQARALRWLGQGLLGLGCFALAGGCVDGPTRPVRSTADLLAQRTAIDAQVAEAQKSLIERSLAHVKGEVDAYAQGTLASPPAMDILIVSGGADWGAFGAGFLKGWKHASDPALRRPVFDVVTGVSTGALIAPFAFVGDDDSIERIDRLYRNPKEDWIKPHGLIRFLNGASSYANIPGLERELNDALDLPELQRIADAGSSGRVLAVNTTNIDTSEARAWDLVPEAVAGTQKRDTSRFRQILLASSAMPGFFPPREIDNMLYVDGGLTGNIIWGGRIQGADTFAAQWAAQYPGVACPKIRYWIIFNNEIRWQPETVQPKWSAIAAKAATTSTRAATVSSIRAPFAHAELERLKHPTEIEIRYIAVPDGWEAPSVTSFSKETMNALADLGERMAADSSTWRTEVP